MLQQSCSQLRPLCFALSSPFVLSRIGHSAFSPNTGNSSARLALFSPRTDMDVEKHTRLLVGLVVNTAMQIILIHAALNQNRPKHFRVSNWGQESPKNILHIVYKSEMAVTCQKTPLSCSVRSQFLFYTSGLFRLGWRLCGFPSIIWSVVMRTVWLCEYSVDKVWVMTFSQKVTAEPEVGERVKPKSFSVSDMGFSHWTLTHAGSVWILLSADFFSQEQHSGFLCPCSTVIPCVCLREECALGSFQHLWDRAGRSDSDSCSRMPRSHPPDQSLTNKDCSVCARTSTRLLQHILLADSHDHCLD